MTVNHVFPWFDQFIFTFKVIMEMYSKETSLQGKSEVAMDTDMKPKVSSQQDT